ncbi:MAG: VOC family protein [Coleofasciculus sp. S288]|nr:VOC family protein [Coleofasciculus sp. S288]
MTEFQLQGINHIALVCKDMARTVDFYTNTLGLRLTKGLSFSASELLPENCPNATQLTCTKGRWFAIIPEE